MAIHLGILAPREGHADLLGVVGTGVRRITERIRRPFVFEGGTYMAIGSSPALASSLWKYPAASAIR